jgi:hypothetical protein
VATKIGTLYAAIRGDERPLKRSLKDAEKSAVKGAKRINGALSKISFKHVIGGFAAFAAATGLARITRATIRLADTQERAEKKLESVLRSTGQAAGFNAEQLKEMAKAMQDVTTVGDEVILNAQAQLLTFKQIRGEAYRRTMMAALDLSEVMDQDLRSSIVMVGKALNDPVANMGALGRAGIQFTKDQKETIKTLWEMGRTAEAQRLILEELESQFGGAAKAARDTFGGELDALKNTLGDIGEEIGFAIMPKLNEMVKGFHGWIQENQTLLNQDLPQYLGDVATNMGNIAIALGNIAKYAGLRSISRTAEEAAELSKRGMLDILEFRKASFIERQRMVDEARAAIARGTGVEDFDAVNAAIQDGTDRTRILTTTTKQLTNEYEALDKVIASVFSDIDKAATKIEDVSATNIWESLDPTESAKSASKFLDPQKAKLPWNADEMFSDPTAMEQVERDWRNRRVAAWEEHVRKMEEIDAALEEAFDLSTVPDEISPMVDLAQNTAERMQDTFSDVFFDYMTGELKSLEDYANAVFRSMARTVADFAAKMAVESIFGAMGGTTGGLFASLLHGGGRVGAGGVPVRLMNADIFSRAPRFHNGLKPDEFPAILQKGETVIPKERSNQDSGSINYHFNISAPDGKIARESQSQLYQMLWNIQNKSAQRNN